MISYQFVLRFDVDDAVTRDVLVGYALDREHEAVMVSFAGQEERVARGGWSSWLAFRLPVVAPLGVPLVALDGLCRPLLLAGDAGVLLRAAGLFGVAATLAPGGGLATHRLQAGDRCLEVAALSDLPAEWLRPKRAGAPVVHAA